MSGAIFQELVERFDDVVIVTDAAYRITYVSPASEKIFGFPAGDLLGNDLFSLVEEKLRMDLGECLSHPVTAQVRKQVYMDVSAGGRRWFDTRVVPVYYNDRAEGLAFHLSETTESIRRENKLIQANQQLDQMIFKTAHDLKAPLMSALGLVNLAGNASPHEKDRYLDMVKSSLLKLDGYLEEMNHFFRNEKLAVQRQKIDIPAVLDDELSNVRHLYEPRGISVRIEKGEISSDFYSDEIRIKTILTNLLSNAIKYSDPEKPAPVIQIRFSITQEWCVIHISDNGVGINPEYKDRIFELFFRATTLSQGTGLGLFIVKDTIVKLDGTIEVQSTPGEGTSFTVRLPNKMR